MPHKKSLINSILVSFRELKTSSLHHLGVVPANHLLAMILDRAVQLIFYFHFIQLENVQLLSNCAMSTRPFGLIEIESCFEMVLRLLDRQNDD